MGLTYTGTIAPNQKLVIDLENRRARYVGANVREKIDGEWFILPVGASLLRVTANPSSVPALVVVQYRERHG